MGAWRLIADKQKAMSPEKRVAIVDEAYRKVFCSESGAIVLRDLMEQSSYFEQMLKMSAHDIAVFSGRRDLVNLILQRTRAAGADIAAAIILNNAKEAMNEHSTASKPGAIPDAIPDAIPAGAAAANAAIPDAIPDAGDPDPEPDPEPDTTDIG